LFYKGQIELCEVGIPISYNLDKKYHYNWIIIPNMYRSPRYLKQNNNLDIPVDLQ
jgi:hypothetical protein